MTKYLMTDWNISSNSVELCHTVRKKNKIFDWPDKPVPTSVEMSVELFCWKCPWNETLAWGAQVWPRMRVKETRGVELSKVCTWFQPTYRSLTLQTSSSSFHYVAKGRKDNGGGTRRETQRFNKAYQKKKKLMQILSYEKTCV